MKIGRRLRALGSERENGKLKLGEVNEEMKSLWN